MSSDESSASDPSDVPFRTRPLGRGWSRAFVIGLFLAIVGLAAGQSYYLISVAESSEAFVPDSTQTDTSTVPPDTTVRRTP